MHKPDIEHIASKHIDIAGQCLYRPGSIAASEWIKFWETVRDVEFDEIDDLRRKLSEALEEIKALEGIVSDMRDELRAKADY